MVPIRRQDNFCANDGPVYWYMYSSPGLDELELVSSMKCHQLWFSFLNTHVPLNLNDTSALVAAIIYTNDYEVLQRVCASLIHLKFTDSNSINDVKWSEVSQHWLFKILINSNLNDASFCENAKEKIWQYASGLTVPQLPKQWLQIGEIRTQIAKFKGPTWGPPGSCRPQMGPTLAPWTLLSGYYLFHILVVFMISNRL